MILRIICFVYLLGSAFILKGQQAQMIERRPDNAPRTETRLNKMDFSGQRQGTWVYYTIYKEKYAEIDYVNDKMEGMVKRYYPGPGDKVREEAEYLNGKKEGAYRKLYYSGETQVEGNYVKGQKEGHWLKYYSDGTIKTEGDYVGGKIEGDWKYYDRKGTLSKIVKFKNGVEYNPVVAADLAVKKAAANASAKTTTKK